LFLDSYISPCIPELNNSCTYTFLTIPTLAALNKSSIIVLILALSIMAFNMPSYLSRLLRPFTTSMTRPAVADSMATMDFPANSQRAVFAGGCFWGVEELYRKHWANKGLLDCRVGYTGGSSDSPTYSEVCSGRSGHAEALMIVFDPEKATYKSFVEFFYKMHDPTTLNRQGADSGTQYRSAIFYTDEEQKKVAEEVKEKVGKVWYKGQPITTEIAQLTKWFDAEDYHQDYIKVQHDRGKYAYQCPAHYIRSFPELS